MRNVLAIFWFLLSLCCHSAAFPATPGLLLSDTVELVTESGQNYCAGVWISRSQILTAYHCVDGEDKLFIRPHGAEQIAATLVRKAPERDLALLSAEFAAHTHAALASVWSVGEPLTIVGHPNHVPFVVVSGVASTNHPLECPNICDLCSREIPYLQVSAPIWYGNSGGGAFDSSGHLVGIASMMSVKVPNTAYFVPPVEIREFLAP